MVRSRIVLAALTLAVPGIASAQTPPPQNPTQATPPGAADPWPRTLADMEARANARFDRIDADGDGFLVGRELAALSQGEWAQRGGARLRGQLSRADADGDGKISREEANVGLAQRFARMDRNGDGVISEDERGVRGAMGMPAQGGQSGGMPDMADGL